METKHPAFWMGHTFSVMTGGAFVISATLNALTFWLTWKMNYFLIASPADVIMSGFILVAAVAVLSAIFAGLGWAVVAFKRGLDKEEAERVRKEAEAAAVLEDYARMMGDRLKGYGVPEDEVETLVEGQKMNRMREVKEVVRIAKLNSIWLLAGAFIVIIAAGSELVTSFSGFGANVTRRPWWYETGLKTAPEYSAFGGACANAPVAWLGSSAAILECSDRVRVIHKLDDLVTVGRYEP